MLRVLAIIICLISSNHIQQQALAQGFGGPVWTRITLQNESMDLLGADGAGYVTDSWYLGGLGFAGNLEHGGNTEAEQGASSIKLAYGGVFSGWQLSLTERMSVFTELAFTSGGLIRKFLNEEVAADTLHFTMLKPAIGMELVLVDWLRLSIGLDYRLPVRRFEQAGLRLDETWGISLGLRFGRFPAP